MSLFDSIITKRLINCPNCDHYASDNFQTKDLDNVLDEFYEGKRTNSYINLKFYAYDYCSECKKMIGQYFKFDKNGILKKVGKHFMEEEK
jgi:hypothetical protein